MKTIGNSTNTANDRGEWTEGNPAAGVPATLLKADWLTTIQRELINVVLAADIALNVNDDSQLLQAVRVLQGKAMKALEQSSPYDGTPGHYLTPGSFGWGSTYQSGPMHLGDMTGDQTTYSGLYRYSPATVGKPAFGSGYGSLLQCSVINDNGSNYATQFVIDYAADAIGFRRLSGTAGWQEFRELYHTGNLGGATTLKAGLVKISTDTLVEGGEDDATALSPLRLKRKTQASVYDGAAAKLLTTGSFGWGSSYNSGPMLLTDITGSQTTYSGLYRYDKNTVGKPTFGSGFGSLLQSSVINDGTGNFATQLVIDYAADAIGIRRLSGTAGWQPFLELYHTGNLGGATTLKAGLVKISTDTLVDGGADDATALSPLRLKRKTQSSLYDGTTGKLVSVGSFGWGSTYQSGPAHVDNMTGDQIMYSGLYRYSPATVGKPAFGSGYGSLLQSSLINDGGGNFATQLVIDYAADAVGIRRLSGAGGWQPFRRLWHDGDFGLASVADVLAGTSPTLVPTVAALVAGILGSGGAGATDYLTIPYRDKTTGQRKSMVLQWTTTPALLNSSSYVWTFPVALTTRVLFVGGMMIGTSSGTLQTSAQTLTSAQFSNGTAGSNGNTAFVFSLGV